MSKLENKIETMEGKLLKLGLAEYLLVESKNKLNINDYSKWLNVWYKNLTDINERLTNVGRYTK